MALGTPVSGTTASAAGSSGTSTISPSYPTGVLATDTLVLFLGMKPFVANGGSVTPPTGWTLQDQLTGAGGYGTTIGADVGNTNLYVYTKNVVTAGLSGTVPVTLDGSNVSWANITRVPSTNGIFSYGSADGQRTTAPTAGTAFTVSLTNGTTATAFASGDLAFWGMCIPTDITTPSQFTLPTAIAAGATFAAGVELGEPDSGLGSDIGGYLAYANCTGGNGTTASVSVVASGTVTNVRGPVVLLRIRETPVIAPNLYTNPNTFYAATVTANNELAPARYDNANVFYAPDVTQAGGAQTLTPDLYTNTNAFYAATVTANNTITPDLYTNTNAIYAATVTANNTITPTRYDNDNEFYAATVTANNELTPARYDNNNIFYSPVVSQAGQTTLFPALYENVNTLFSPTVSSVLPPGENFVKDVILRSFTERRRF